MCSGGFGTEATKKTDQGLKAVLGKASYFITGMQPNVLQVMIALAITAAITLTFCFGVGWVLRVLLVAKARYSRI